MFLCFFVVVTSTDSCLERLVSKHDPLCVEWDVKPRYVELNASDLEL